MSSVIEIKPLTRVEGHGVVRVYLDGSKVDRVELALVEPPRLFEALLHGKHFQEIPDIICRICSLCSTIHRVTALMAIEAAMGIDVSYESRLYRELIVYGGHIQSHALHLFCLSLPDYFQTAGFADLATREPDLLKLGLRIKALGNMIQETVGGRLIHPVNVKLGGIGQQLGKEKLLMLQDGARSALPDMHRAVELFASFGRTEQPLPAPVLMAVTPCGSAALFGDILSTSSGKSFSSSKYGNFLNEKVTLHSHAKISKINEDVVTVGALARLNMGLVLSPMAREVFLHAKENLINRDIWSNNLAQAVELVFATETALDIIELLLQGPCLAGTTSSSADTMNNRRGTAATEAPRGVLIHSYSFDRRGFCTAADIITPTAINQEAMERDLLSLAQSLVLTDEEELRSKLEMLIRAYDPCISCAVHLVRL